MKPFALLTLLFCSGLVFGQDKPLSNDERGKLIYYEVVSLKDVPADSLNTRVMNFLKAGAGMLKITSSGTDSLISASGKLVIHKTALVLSRPSGEVKYNFFAETRDQKYRFWLSDFEFIPYQRDRYGNFVPSTSIAVPLERKPGKLNAAEWTGYLKATTREANSFAAKLKEAMADKSLTPTVSTQKW